MRVLCMSLIVFFNFIFESTLFRYLQIRHIQPNTAVAFTVSYAVLRGSVEGSIFGFCAGMLLDIFFGDSIGYYALIYMTIGYVCGVPTDNFFKDNFYVPLLFCIACMLISGLFIYITGFLIRGKLDFLFYFNNIILPETVYTAVFSFFVYRLMFDLNRKLEAYEHDKRKVF